MRTRAILSAILVCTCCATLMLAQVSPTDYPALNSERRTAIIDSVSQTMIDNYVFPDMGLECAQLLRNNRNNGMYDTITDLRNLTQKLTEDLQSFTHDLHIEVSPIPLEEAQYYIKQDGKEELDTALVRRRLERRQFANFGFERVERLDGNIGYIKLNNFANAGQAGATAVAAMTFLSYCDALIFDLRQNTGGDPSMVQLISSYLFDGPKHLNNFFVRDKAGDNTEQYWSQSWVPGLRFVDTPVYVLTSSATFSAGEEFSYNLKSLKRATIVGDTTGGGAHPENKFAFPEQFVLMAVPYARSINPVTKTDWEGVGVIPDIACESGSAFEIAQLDALRKLRASATEEEYVFRLDWAIEGLESKLNPVVLSAAQMRRCVGDFGVRHVRLQENRLYYQRDGQPLYLLHPMGNQFFRFDEMNYFRIEIVLDADGSAQKIVGHYDNGDTDESPRTK